MNAPADLIPLLIETGNPAGCVYSGSLLVDMPKGSRFTGKFGDSFACELSGELAEKARKARLPVALVNLSTMCAEEIRPGKEFPQIRELRRVQSCQ